MNVPLSEDRPLLDAALELAGHGVRLTPGSYVSAEGACSCEFPGCRTPGAHPVVPTWRHSASSKPLLLAQWWAGWPQANLIAPLMGTFEVIDLPQQVADIALQDLQSIDGSLPVVVAPTGREQFWVRPGTIGKLLRALSEQEPTDARPDLRVYQQGFYVVAPPSRVGSAHAYGWHRPLGAHIQTLASPAPIVEAVVSAYRSIPG